MENKQTFKPKQSSGQVWIWLTGLSTALGLLMVTGLLGLIFINGFSIFWPAELQQFELKDGSQVLGEVWEKTEFKSDETGDLETRLRVKIANRDIYGLDFKWLNEKAVSGITVPDSAMLLERTSWGQFFGFPEKLTIGGTVKATGEAAVLRQMPEYQQEVNALLEQIQQIEKVQIAEISYRTSDLQLQLKGLKTNRDDSLRRVAIEQQLNDLKSAFKKTEKRLIGLRNQASGFVLTLRAVSGETREIELANIVRSLQPNKMSAFAKSVAYLDRLWEFLSDDPREANMEGGVLPAIFGTVMMVFIMSLAVVPLGVLAAIYLHEYARQGLFVKILRIAVNNLAGVPSIVYGIFGLGFFVYVIGGSIDRLFFAESLPNPTFGTGGILWASLTLALLTVPVVIVTAEEGLAAVPKSVREGSVALGATKFETLWRVILPSASPSIFTGMILAIARAAGEVAPLMVTGVVKLAPSLPIDGYFPFIHFERKFMHLGFHIYDVGFQSPNVEAALPMVYATTLLLIVIVVALNLSAVFLRKSLQKRFAVTHL